MFSGCDNYLKKPVGVHLEIRQVNEKNDSIYNLIKPTGSFFRLTKVNIDTDRKNGKDITLSLEPQKDFSLTGEDSVIISSFEIPQGSYTDLQIEFYLDGLSYQQNITGTGSYDGNDYDINVNIQKEIKIKLAYNNSSGNSIMISEEFPVEFQIQFYIDKVFQEISMNRIINAVPHAAYQSEIIIDYQNYPEIYQEILNNLEQSFELKIIKIEQ
jgi:hypothetical protein